MKENAESFPLLTEDDFSEIAKRVGQILEEGLREEDVQIVQHQLGRFPRGMVGVGARCRCGNPLVVITRPLIDGTLPFPTTCYLTHPQAVKALSRLEADGQMKIYSEQLHEDEAIQQRYEYAHQYYLALRREIAERLGDTETHIEGISAGGMPERVKCLHALAGFSLVVGKGVNPIGDSALRDAAHSAYAVFDTQHCYCRS